MWTLPAAQFPWSPWITDIKLPFKAHFQVSAGQIKLSCFVRHPPLWSARNVWLTSPEKHEQHNLITSRKSVNITLFHPFMSVDKKTMCKEEINLLWQPHQRVQRGAYCYLRRRNAVAKRQSKTYQPFKDFTIFERAGWGVTGGQTLHCDNTPTINKSVKTTRLDVEMLRVDFAVALICPWLFWGWFIITKHGF